MPALACRSLAALFLMASSAAFAAPPGEAPAPADPGLAASCQAEARAQLGDTRPQFGPPAFTVRDTLRTVRMDVVLPGQARAADGVLRAICTRNVDGTVDTAMVDEAVDGGGPRIILLGGTGSGAAGFAAADSGYRLVARNPNAVTDNSLPGLWAPFPAWSCVDCQRFVRRAPTAPVRTRPALELSRPATAAFVPGPRHGAARFNARPAARIVIGIGR